MGLGVYGASGGDNEVLTLTESTEWKASFVWNKIYDAGGALVGDNVLLVGSVDDGSGNYVFSGKGFDPNYEDGAVPGHDPYFRIKVDSGMKGDALVALRNSAGIILWSWHIWVTDYDPDVEMTPVSGTYVYPVTGGALHRYSGTIWGAGKEYENAFIMDRNLGALSSYGEIGDTRGAYYQFGRKDPEPATAATTARQTNPSMIPARPDGGSRFMASGRISLRARRSGSRRRPDDTIIPEEIPPTAASGTLPPGNGFIMVPLGVVSALMATTGLLRRLPGVLTTFA